MCMQIRTDTIVVTGKFAGAALVESAEKLICKLCI